MKVKQCPEPLSNEEVYKTYRSARVKDPRFITMISGRPPDEVGVKGGRPDPIKLPMYYKVIHLQDIETNYMTIYPMKVNVLIKIRRNTSFSVT